MAKSNLAALLKRLDEARTQHGSVSEQHYLQLLTSAGRIDFGADAQSLIRFHDVCLFLRAFPPGQRVLRLADRLLAEFEKRVKAALAAGADADDFAPEEVAGIAGTVVEATYSYPMMCWLVQHHTHAISVAWDQFERETQRASTWPRFFPLLEEDSFTEANVPYLEWLKTARGRQAELPWLVQCFQRLPISEKEKGELYDSLELLVRWDLSGSLASRTVARRSVRQFYFHRTPLIVRRQVSLADELSKPALPMKILSRKQAEKTLDTVKETLGVRYRELYGTSNSDPGWVVQCSVGRGVEIHLWGLTPETRHPLRAYLAGFTLKNGVPINYFEVLSLFDWLELGFNTFPAYRDGETAWIYAQTLRLLRQIYGVKVISVYPYQIGDGNEEAIDSGAFWFYRKLGFRSMNPGLEKLAQAEEKKVLADRAYRTSARTLRRLSKAHVVYEMPGADVGAWDGFAIRNIGFALQRRMAREFGGDVARMRKLCTEKIARQLNAEPEQMSANQQKAFADFAMAVSLDPALSRWSPEEKAGVLDVIAAKAGKMEQRYMRLLQKHQRLRKAILRLGSSVS